MTTMIKCKGCGQKNEVVTERVRFRSVKDSGFPETTFTTICSSCEKTIKRTIKARKG